MMHKYRDVDDRSICSNDKEYLNRDVYVLNNNLEAFGIVINSSIE